jgi:hypothetical protein
VTELPSDNLQVNGFEGGSLPLDALTWTEENGTITGMWQYLYSIIARANTVLDRIENVDFNSALKEQYKAEAKFIRALMYFNLVQLWGEVPLSVHEITSEAEAYSLLREPVDKVYAQIEKDLKEAADVLPVEFTGNNTGRATKGAAQGLLGKVYVTSKQYGNAASVLENVIRSNKYSLLPVYGDIFLPDNGNNAETVFAVQYTSTGFGEGSNFFAASTPRGSGTTFISPAISTQSMEGTWDLFDAFEEDDTRKSVAIDHYEQGTYGGVYFTRKYLERTTTGYEGNCDWIILRYADILLLYAEALNESGQTGNAENPLNEVRSRAALEPLSGLNQNEMRLAIEHERRVELCFEGHRWFDLIRVPGRMVEVLSAYKEKYTAIGYQVGSYEIAPHKALLPIPFKDRSLNPDLTQNEGYN